MIFVLLYDRASHMLVSINEFLDNEASANYESSLRKDHTEERWEIVALEAASENVLRRTHARYFEQAGDLIEDIRRRTVETNSSDVPQNHEQDA
jgi:hypothetical protein